MSSKPRSALDAGFASCFDIGSHWPGASAMTTGINRPQRRLGLVFASVATIVLVAGCSYPNQFRNVSADAPHAVLVGHHVTIFHINQQPTSFWRCRERFRIPPGSTTVQPVTGVWDFPEYPVIEFAAVAGHRYTLTHQKSNDCHRVFVWAHPTDTDEKRVVAQVEAKRKRTNE